MFYQGYWIPDELTGDAYTYDQSAATGGPPGGYPDLSQLPMTDAGGIPIMSTVPGAPYMGSTGGSDPTQPGYGTGFSSTVTDMSGSDQPTGGDSGSGPVYYGYNIPTGGSGGSDVTGGSSGPVYYGSDIPPAAQPGNSQYGATPVTSGSSAVSPLAAPSAPARTGPKSSSTPQSGQNTVNQSVGLPSAAYASSMAPVPQFSYKPVQIQTPGSPQMAPMSAPQLPDYASGGQDQGTPSVQKPRTPGNRVTFGPASADQGVTGQSTTQGKQPSTLRNIAGAAARMLGVDINNPIPPAYRGIYEEIAKAKRKQQGIQGPAPTLADAYRNTYGLE